MAVLLPAYILSVVLAIPILYAGMNFLSVPQCDSLQTLVDDYSREAYDGANGVILETKGNPTLIHSNLSVDRFLRKDSTLPEIYDIDVAIINQMLMQKCNSKAC